MKKILSILLIAVILSAMLPISQVQAAGKTASAYLADGNKYISLGKYMDAIKAFDSAIKLNSKYTEAYVGKGRALNGLRKFNDALQSFDKAISFNAKYAPAFYYKGLALSGLGKFPDSINAYSTAITLNPKYAEAYDEKGYALENMKKYDDAIKSYDTAIRLNNKLVNAYIHKAQLLLLQYKKYPEANTTLDAALKLAPANNTALQFKALTLQALNKHTEAIAYFDKAIKVFPAPSYYYGKGYSQYMLKNYADAVVSLSKAIETYPENLSANADYYYYRALAYRDLGKYDLSLKDMAKGVEIRPSSIDKLTGKIQDSKYINEYLGMELALPTEWSSRSIDLYKLVEQYKIQGNIQLSQLSLPLMVSKYPAGSTDKPNPNLMLILENISAYPDIKAGADFLPYVLSLAASQRTYKYDQNFEKVTLDSVSFDVVNASTQENGVLINQKLYTTVHRGYALCFVLSYTDKSELSELENILKAIEFAK